MLKLFLALPLVLCGSAPSPVLMTAMARSGPPTRYEPAPMPDADAAPPPGPAARTGARLNPAIFSTAKARYRGDGFVADSSEQVSEQRNFRPAGGLSLIMPLQ